MAVKFNPFTGQLQIDEKGASASYIDGEVATYNDLPLDGTAALNSAWLVRSASGVWPVSRKQAGIYIRTATGGSSRDADYTYAGTMPDVFSDANFTLYDEASTTRTGQFNLGSITAGQNRVLTWPDSNGTIALLSNFLSATKDMIVLAPSADVTIASNTTLTGVTGMSFTAAATTTYLLVCYWQVDTGAGGYRMVLNVPSNFQGAASQNGYGINISGANAATGVSTIGVDALNIQSVSRAAAQTGPTFSIFAFRTTGTGGTAEFRYSQASSNAANSTLKAESRVLVIPVAS